MNYLDYIGGCAAIVGLAAGVYSWLLWADKQTPALTRDYDDQDAIEEGRKI